MDRKQKANCVQIKNFLIQKMDDKVYGNKLYWENRSSGIWKLLYYHDQKEQQVFKSWNETKIRKKKSKASFKDSFHQTLKYLENKNLIEELDSEMKRYRRFQFLDWSVPTSNPVKEEKKRKIMVIEVQANKRSKTYTLCGLIELDKNESLNTEKIVTMSPFSTISSSETENACASLYEYNNPFSAHQNVCTILNPSLDDNLQFNTSQMNTFRITDEQTSSQFSAFFSPNTENGPAPSFSVLKNVCQILDPSMENNSYFKTSQTNYFDNTHEQTNSLSSTVSSPDTESAPQSPYDNTMAFSYSPVPQSVGENGVPSAEDSFNMNEFFIPLPEESSSMKAEDVLSLKPSLNYDSKIFDVDTFLNPLPLSNVQSFQ